ncbi:hypothetical protein KJ564_08135 [bacterium]|nr:hypothetical protein [bacterium]
MIEKRIQKTGVRIQKKLEQNLMKTVIANGSISRMADGEVRQSHSNNGHRERSEVPKASGHCRTIFAPNRECNHA